MTNEEQPYLYKTKTIVVTERYENPNYGGNRVCKCGHTYHRHFDPYESDQTAVGCKYCYDCHTFEENKGYWDCNCGTSNKILPDTIEIRCSKCNEIRRFVK